MFPIRLVTRIGAGKLWIAWIVFILGFREVWPDGPFGWIVLGYLLFAIYTWVTPFLLRKWLTRKGEL